jgi:hypothetical protein
MERTIPEPLKANGQDSALRGKWIRIWEEVGRRILSLPLWMQGILLEDVNTAVANRVATMEMIVNAHGKH